MKKKIYSIVTLAAMILSLSSCADYFLNFDPMDKATEAIYYQKAEHFKAAANNQYSKLYGFKSVTSKINGIEYKSSPYDYDDGGCDLFVGTTAYGTGSISIPSSDTYYRLAYVSIRESNTIITKGDEYPRDKNEIKEYVAAAHFFRAYQYFFLLKRFGGMPILTNPLTPESEELFAKRNSRYEVISLILSDLQTAITGLPKEKAMDGHLSKQAAMAFKARVLLYEATWEKNVGTTTDGDGIDKGAGSSKPGDYPTITSMLTEAVALSKEVMTDNTYALWSWKGTKFEKWAYYYLFNLDDAASNPLGKTKDTNKEFILSSVYDYNLNKCGSNLTKSWDPDGRGLSPNRKLMDMFLCKDGLPYRYSDNYKGYNKMTDEFDGRDYRLVSCVRIPGQTYWGYMGAGDGANYEKANYVDLFNFTNGAVTHYPDLTTSIDYGGYRNRKFTMEHAKRKDYEESYNYPHIRLSEMYLIYAEALYELNGNISDTDLKISINKLRERAGVEDLTNALVTKANVNALTRGLAPINMLDLIRNERAVEMIGESTRFDDLKRWGIAEKELNKAICGMVVENADGTPTEVTSFKYNNKPLYNSSIYIYGTENKALILHPSAARTFKREHYLNPLPSDQLQLNVQLKQNAGY